MIAINAAMANQLNEFKASIDKLMEEGIGKDEAIFRILKETIIASEAIRFEGDGYSDQWKEEAARRGLTNICHVPEALMHYMDNQSRSVLIGERIFNETELACRLEVELEKYTMKVQIESRVLGDLAINHIVPIAVSYQNRLLENLLGLKEIFSPEEYEVLSADRKELIREISKRVTAIKVLVREMTEARKVANHMDSYKDKAFAYEENVRPYLERYVIISITLKWRSTTRFGRCRNIGNCCSQNDNLALRAKLSESYELPVHKLLCYKPESYYIVTYTHIPKATCSLYPVACHLIPYLKIPARLLHLFVSFVQYLIFSFYICAV